MRHSAVAAAWKWLHPQLPLNTKESHRLLTALTGSFQKHLDKEYPTSAEQDNGHGAKTGATEGRKRTPPSSAALADKHLASVLTSPLLTRPARPVKPLLDTGTAALELTKDPGKDPITLLEEYQAKGAANIGVASLCLSKAYDSVQSLDENARSNRVHKLQAGARVLHWLWASGYYDSLSFAEDLEFMDRMTYFLVEEELEKYIWEWFLVESKPTKAVEEEMQKYRTYEKKQFARYKWKGRLLAGLIRAKLDRVANGKADEAIEAFLRARDLRANAEQTSPARWLPLAAAGVPIGKALYSLAYQSTNIDLWDKFTESAGDWETPRGAGWTIAGISLAHPRSPDSVPALQELRRLFTAHGPAEQKWRLNLRGSTPEHHYRGYLNHFMIRTAFHLDDQGHFQDAEWVLNMRKEYLPELTPYMKEHLLRYGRQWEALERRGEEPLTPERTPYPTFA